MNVLQIEILNPKAKRLLKDLADMDLIIIRKPADDGFLKLVQKFRTKAKKDKTDLEDISREIDVIRAAKYEKSKA